MNTVTRAARLRRAISLTAATAVVSTALIAAAPAAHAADAKKLSLLNFNDFHGRIMKPVYDVANPANSTPGTAHFAAVIEQQRKAIADAGGSSVLLSGGDNIGASLFASSMAKDQPTIDVLNALDLAASAVGNHEFDQGYTDLVDRVINGGTNATWPYLGANVRKADGSAALDEYVVKEVGGVKIGVIGVVTQETPSLVSPAGVAGLEFDDPVAAVNRVAAQLTDGNDANGEAQVIVAEYHEGAPGADSLSNQLAASPVFKRIVNDTSPKVDVIFNAHTHQRYAWVSEAGSVRRPITQAESYGTYVARVDLTYDATSDAVTLVDSKNIQVTATTAAALDQQIADFPKVGTVNTIVNTAIAAADVVGLEKVAEVTADITTAGTGGSWTGGVYTWPTPPKRDDRASESTLGSLVADSLVSALSPSNRGGATIGVVNPGGLRAELYKGTDNGVITYAEANAVLPFVNNLWTTTLTGAQFKTMLEQQWQRDAKGDVPTRPYLQLGLSKNVSYTFDATRPEGDRITSISIDRKAYDPAAKYRIGTFSFLTQGGDNFRIFTQGTDAKDSGLVDRDAWIDYLKTSRLLTPSFARRSVSAPALDPVKAGSQVTFTLQSLNLTSSGSPANTTVNVKLGSLRLGDFPVTDGSATVKVTIPLGTAAGDHQLVATASPSRTVVRMPVTVTGADFAAAAVPKIIGTVRVGSTVGVATGTWSPRPVFSYAWLLDGKAIPGATDDNLVVTPGMGGHRLQVQVTGTSTGYTPTVRTSAATTVAKLTFTTTARPTIHGTAKVGHKLTVSTGKWSPKPTFTYTWRANGQVIKGATTSSLKLTKAQAGKRITVVVTGSRLGYNTVARASSATKTVRR